MFKSLRQSDWQERITCLSPVVSSASAAFFKRVREKAEPTGSVFIAPWPCHGVKEMHCSSVKQMERAKDIFSESSWQKKIPCRSSGGGARICSYFLCSKGPVYRRHLSSLQSQQRPWLSCLASGGFTAADCQSAVICKITQGRGGLFSSIPEKKFFILFGTIFHNNISYYNDISYNMLYPIENNLISS